ncbi:MAG: DUF1622 domain-containing protein [bacterium]
MIDTNMYYEVVAGVARFISFIGLVVIIWGIILVIRDFLQNITCDDPRLNRNLRQKLGSYLILALEFFIAADIIRTIARPDWNEIAMLAAIIALRTILSFFLGLELKEAPCVNGKTGKKK